MLIDDIKKANIEAMKAHDSAARSAYSAVISRYQLLKAQDPEKEIPDADVLGIIQKVAKELEEEKASYVAANRPEQAEEVAKEQACLAKFVPAQLTEEEIRKIIATLPDHSMPAIMKHFSANYKGRVDMRLVGKIAKEN
jgi:hypothetical protein